MKRKRNAMEPGCNHKLMSLQGKAKKLNLTASTVHELTAAAIVGPIARGFAPGAPQSLEFRVFLQGRAPGLQRLV
ncbi:hypothetical protein JI739_15745 [Ramlibacter sp. AW1]|uniref:Uncharacterized protein n=1 Tax=Ramlibacter aurantiacus TaxID=2801330 RepID=A0A936ZL37_9BURK|nr:hypothetical protein [Ramlibacter aurantiacus]MBL0421802.1 hypothetical protein [Ramlibacter aurantiacus]